MSTSKKITREDERHLQDAVKNKAIEMISSEMKVNEKFLDADLITHLAFAEVLEWEENLTDEAVKVIRQINGQYWWIVEELGRRASDVYFDYNVGHHRKFYYQLVDHAGDCQWLKVGWEREDVDYATNTIYYRWIGDGMEVKVLVKLQRLDTRDPITGEIQFTNEIQVCKFKDFRDGAYLTGETILTYNAKYVESMEPLLYHLRHISAF